MGEAVTQVDGGGKRTGLGVMRGHGGHTEGRSGGPGGGGTAAMAETFGGKRCGRG